MQSKLRQWEWSPIPWYNGFSNAERIRGWQVQWYLISKGALPILRTLSCQVCGGAERCNYHLEDYYDPLNKGMPLCSEHHKMLHRRFYDPESWRAALKAFGQDIAQWESILSTEPNEDWASPQVAKHGEEVRTTTLFLPDALKQEFPFDQLHPLEPPAEHARSLARFRETGKAFDEPHDVLAPVSHTT